MSCHKKAMDKISALMLIAKNKGSRNRNFKRREIREYYCGYCNAYHVTSKNK